MRRSVSCARPKGLRASGFGLRASGFGESNPLQRIWRDIETGSRHAVLNPDVATELYGKSLFGIRGTVSAMV
ncbi:hypothetical protein ACF073_23055 [Streptomyces sp. NPDC015171]|uniref:hypothetical protein n=1 Tax=Streptomyces sp. NPDC015171 TaxID=3364945 RepID=UPI0036FE095A